jgi:hypothetical protein
VTDGCFYGNRISPNDESALENLARYIQAKLGAVAPENSSLSPRKRGKLTR